MGEKDERIEGIQHLWTVGDYRRIGELFTPISDQLIVELDREFGLSTCSVLDAATGTGNTALAAARAGAHVSGFDLTPRLLEIAQHRAAQEALDITLVSGDLLDIPFPDDAFDVVVSTFGSFTADDQERCAAELVRVCRPGGLVVTTAWADEGIFASMLDVVLAAHPELKDPSRPDPDKWSHLEGVAHITAGLPVAVEVERRREPFVFTHPEAAMILFEEASGPVKGMRAGVERCGGDWESVRGAVIERWSTEAIAVDGGVRLDGVYGLSRWLVDGT